MRLWPAVDVSRVSDPDLVLAAVDEFAPTAAEQLGDTFRIFFPTSAARDAAHAALAADSCDATAIDISDEDWARRSQEGLGPITVGRVTVYPDLQPPVSSPQSPVSSPISIVIPPSMGFGTGHHATTRLCLAALQETELTGRVVLDVGTGSGILAIAASLLGAGQVVGIDNDADAIQAATENVLLNRGARVALRVGDLHAATLPAADVLTANLTGALLRKSATTLLALVRPGGTLILSGYLDDERETMRDAFRRCAVVSEREEQRWIGLAMKKS